MIIVLEMELCPHLPMNIRVWRKAIRLPQTYLLLGGLGVGYAALIGVAGPRWLAVGGGGVISLAMAGAWIRHIEGIAPSANLLDATVFQDQLWPYQTLVPAASRTQWDQAVQQAQMAQELATQIGERYPDVVSELLQILYSVLALLEQIAKSAQALQHLETSTYQQLTQERLTQAMDQIQQTQDQLRSLHDQLVLSGLDPTMAGQTVSLPLHLTEMTEANRAILHMNMSAQLEKSS